MKKTLCPDSFDPPTLGEIDMIRRAAKLFDQVTVLVQPQPEKAFLLCGERIEILQEELAELPYVSVEPFHGLLLQYSNQTGASIIIKPLYTAADFEREFQLRQVNQLLFPGIDTIFMPLPPQDIGHFPAVIKEYLVLGGDPKELLPPGRQCSFPSSNKTGCSETQADTTPSNLKFHDFNAYGPLAFDGAISKERAAHKGIGGAVEGSADILVMPNIGTANVFYRCLTCVAKVELASLVCGTTSPVIMTSRADDTKDKYNFILFSVLHCIKNRARKFCRRIKIMLSRTFLAATVPAETTSVMDFIIGEIPFLLFMALLVYFFWIRPKKKAKREENDKNRYTQVGDEIIFSDGMTGLFLKVADDKIHFESGSKHNKFSLAKDYLMENISANERLKEAYDKLTFWQKLASRI